MAAPPTRFFAEVQHLPSFTPALHRIADGLAAACATNDAVEYVEGSSRWDKWFRNPEYAKISVQDLLVRLVKYCKSSPNVFIGMAIFVDRLRHTTNLPVRSDNVHQFVMAAFMISVKTTDDIVFSNKDYAVVPGYTGQFLNELELVALLALDWSVFVEGSLYDKYRFELTQSQRASFRRTSSVSLPKSLERLPTPPDVRRRASNPRMMRRVSSVSTVTPMLVQKGSPILARRGSGFPRVPSLPPADSGRMPRPPRRILSTESIDTAGNSSAYGSPNADLSPQGSGFRAVRMRDMYAPSSVLRRASIQLEQVKQLQMFQCQLE
eukprot:TRINITY_DN5118_c1_g1_i1.p1 TRINITY_DN5118_c1_g1~~TRINITY_DN5118_c1_g1_i1.p1  ORF type:complete len:336 (+),score=81.37 TRINITY_DN5118_c1_g1_i1:45-1010(+)